MNNEIMEILDKFSNRKQGTLLQAIRELKEQDVKHACVTTEENINKLLNYITNLQKENQSLKNNYNDNEQAIHKIMEENEKLKDELKYTIPQVEHNQIVSKLCREKQEYKSRCEKAIEYIKEHQRKDEFLNLNEWQTRDLLNILSGGVKE